MSQGSDTLAIIQARMASARLPGKVLADIEGEPMLMRVVSRLRLSASLDQVLVATTVESSDDPVAALCAERGQDCYRGHPTDVLDRFVQAARVFEPRTIVRVTADCPLIDPGLVDQAVQAYRDADPPVDFVANRLPGRRTYPIGLDVEVCSYVALETAWREAKAPHHREHVMPYFYESGSRFRQRILDHATDVGHLRWTVDTREDLELIRKIYARFKPRVDFSWLEVLDLVERHPELTAINMHVEHKGIRDIDSRLIPPDQGNRTG